MFKPRQKGNPYVDRLKLIMEDTIKASCSSVLLPLVDAFFNKLQQSQIELLSENQLHWERVIRLGIATKLLVQNTIMYAVKEADVEAFRKLFIELEVLHSEVLKNYSEGSSDRNVSYKITVISTVFYSNTSRATSNSLYEAYSREGMLFHDYEYLWKFIHKMNVEWEDLIKRGFSQEVFKHFCEFVTYHRYLNAYHEEPDHITYGHLLNILDGTCKLIPVYECKPVSYEIAEVGQPETRVVKEFNTLNSQVIQLKKT